MTTRERKPRTPCTPDDLAALSGISPANVNYCPSTPPKKFAREMRTATELTDGQRAYLWSIVWTFRRQIADKRLVKIAEGIREAKGRPGKSLPSATSAVE